MPNERSRRRAARRVDFIPRLRMAPVLLIGLVAVAILGHTPAADMPVRWTVRDAGGWMNEFEPLHQARSALIAANPVAVRTARIAGTGDPGASGPFPAAGEVKSAALVMAEADLTPRHEVKQVPIDAVDPDITGAVPGKRPTVTPASEIQPTVNRSGKGDRLLTPQPYGRTTDRDLFVKPSLAAVPPSQEGWPPLMALASMIAPQPAKVLPQLALAAPDRTPVDGRMVVAMVRTGPGKVVTQSAIAALGERRGKASGHPMLPPVPEAQVASARTTVWTQPDVPEIGYARKTDGILARFRAVLGDEADPVPAKPKAD